MSFEKSTPNIRKFWLYITSFSTIALLSIGIGSFFLPQGRLDNAIYYHKEDFRYIWNRASTERPTDSINIINDLFFSHNNEDNKLNLKYLFKDDSFNPATYNDARQLFLSYTDDDKSKLFIKINRLNEVDHNDLSAKFSSHTKSFQEFANDWIIEAQFQYVASGGFYNSTVITLSAILPFPIYNFYFYRRFSGYNIWLKKLWNRRH